MTGLAAGVWAVQAYEMFEDDWETICDGFADADHAWTQLQAEARRRYDQDMQQYNWDRLESIRLDGEAEKAREILKMMDIDPKIRIASRFRAVDLKMPPPVKDYEKLLRIVKCG